jgi:hypothetical protein
MYYIGFFDMILNKREIDSNLLDRTGTLLLQVLTNRIKP